MNYSTVLVVLVILAGVNGVSWPPNSFTTDIEMHINEFTLNTKFLSSMELSRTKTAYQGVSFEEGVYAANGNGSLRYVWTNEHDCVTKKTQDRFPMAAYSKPNGSREIHGVKVDCFNSNDNVLTLCIKQEDHGIPVYQSVVDAHTFKPITEFYFTDFIPGRPADELLAVPTFCEHSMGHLLHPMHRHHHKQQYREAIHIFREVLRMHN